MQPGTQVFYGTGAAANAQQIAVQFGATATALSTLAAGHVEVLIGSTVSAVPVGLAPTSTATAAATPAAGTRAAAGTPAAGTAVVGAQVIGARAAASPSATPTPSSTAGDGASGMGDTVTVAPNAPYGIPCVY